MSGTAKVKPPRTDAEFARNTQRRIEQVEHPSSARVGPWVISTDAESGALIASHVNGGAVVLANQPEGDGEADAVTSEYSAVKVERRATQNIPGGTHTAVSWDTVEHSTDDWSVSAGSTSLVIPRAGIWQVTFNWFLTASVTVATAARVYIDGAPRMSSRIAAPASGSGPAISMTDSFSLSAGAELYATGWYSGTSSASLTMGPDVTVSSAVTSLSLTRLPIGY